MSGWATPLAHLREEVDQRRDEGCAIPADLAAAIADLAPDRDAWDRVRIEPLYDALMALPMDAALAQREPDDLDAIRALRPDRQRDLAWRPDDELLHDRLHGAWLGRAFGCALGKPVEHFGCTYDARRRPIGRARLRQYLERRGDWPLVDYLSARDVGDGERLICPASWREHVAFAEPDDDLQYTVVATMLLERHGAGFAWHDVAQEWLERIPVAGLATAEANAMRNWQSRWSRIAPGDATPAFTRRHRNPYREYIGAQIRADAYGYACAGRPELAAELAWRDACWTHERNGVYGAMFVAAMVAAAFVVDDAPAIVASGLAEIPRDCRLARAVRVAMAAARAGGDWQDAAAAIEDHCGAMSHGHVVNNAAVVALALVAGALDPLASPAIAVMAGMDTDCDGATVGSIVGAVRGARAFADGPASRLHDEMHLQLAGCGRLRLAECATRSAALRRALVG